MDATGDLFIEEINNKQINAFHDLFRKFYPSLVSFAVRYVGEQQVAEDIVQDVFVMVWEKPDHFLSYTSLKTYLYNSVKNTSLNYIKHKKVEAKYFDYSLLHNQEEHVDNPEALEEEVYRLLFKIIDEMPPRCREIFLLHLEGKKNEDIASALHISLLTVKTQKKKAMHLLRSQMNNSLFFYFFPYPL